MLACDVLVIFVGAEKSPIRREGNLQVVLAGSSLEEDRIAAVGILLVVARSCFIYHVSAGSWF